MNKKILKKIHMFSSLVESNEFEQLFIGNKKSR